MPILIVDDSVVIRKTLTILLRKAGYEELVSLSSAAEARSYLEAQKEGEVELVLLDFQMPDETGLELLTQLKRDTRFRDIPFIMITAEKEETILEQAFSAGATDYISKPLRPIELAARVRSALNLSAEMNRRRTREKELVEITTQLKDANRKLEAISRLDGLTGVANRRMFDEKLQKEWRRCARSGRPLSIIMIDIDHFKGFNDYYGHLEGDESLRSVANAVRNSSGRNTARAAVGGEFPTRTLSVVRRDPSSTIAHVSASPPLIPDSRISRVRLAAAAFPRGPSQAPRSLSTRLHTPLGYIVIPPARHHWD